MSDAGDVGPELRDLVRHARDLNDLVHEQVIAAGSGAAQDVRGMCDEMGNRLGQLEALLDDGSSTPTVH